MEADIVDIFGQWLFDHELYKKVVKKTPLPL